MASLIDPTKPVFGTPTTQSVRDNFATAASEITALQAQVFAPVLVVSAGPSATVPAGTLRVFVTTTAAVTLALPQNDCQIIDRSGNRTNPITVLPPGAATINGLGAFSLVNNWQAASFIWDGTNYAVIG